MARARKKSGATGPTPSPAAKSGRGAKKKPDSGKPKGGWIRQLPATYRMARKQDARIGLYTALAVLLGALLGFALFWFTTTPFPTALRILLTVVGTVMTAALGGLFLFGRRAQAAAYRQIEGQPGAAASVMQTLRRGWKVYPMIAFTKQQDVVHRVVGRPGIILVGEGNPQRLRGLLATEQRKHERVAAEVPITTLISGTGDGEIPLAKLNRHITKQKRAVKPAEITDVINRLKAFDATRSQVPMPKGPMPTSMKGLRGNLRGR